MGCGKSTIGRRVARKWKASFLDTDAWIEEKEGITISEIFTTKGEPYFRDLETECLKSLLEKAKCEKSICGEALERGDKEKEFFVISVGGGLPVREENQKLLKQLGYVIYLKATPDTIYERIKGDTTRPLLQGDNPKQKIKNLMDQREEIYCQASEYIVEVDSKKVKDIMTKQPKSVGIDTKIAAIEEILHLYKIHAVLVLDTNNHLLGIVDSFSTRI